MIPVTKPFLPPVEMYNEYIAGIWQRQWLTNHGPLVTELELKLKELLGVNHLLFLSNGTIALQIAIKALDLKGEIITTPYSYIATTSTIVWEGCKPVFVDVDENSFNINPSLIEEAITDKTSAILATHVYGNPCDVFAIEAIAKKHKLKVIYDAAHAFGVTVNGKSIFEYGDISTTSFHATKLFHTGEGGAVFTKDAELLRKMSLLRNFGHTSPVSFEGIGINGKNSEFHAAVGLCNLNFIDKILAKRKEQCIYYNERLQALNAVQQAIYKNTEFNYSYYPVILQNEEILLKTIDSLQEHQVFPRRYFYPALSDVAYTGNQSCPVAESIARRALCLPLYYSLSKEEQDMVCSVILKVENN
ncbi:MAG: DegT/DnrJ/EryC1/StrS family aminotransferase [Ferruginibacter sp.]